MPLAGDTPTTTQLLAHRPGQLPVEVTGFVGRSDELAAVSELLGSARLVTVTGPGGVGKTRLALKAASQTQADYRDGVCLAELSGLPDPELLPGTIAACLGLIDSGLDAVLDYLRDRELLLILDTCEHLVDACAMLADVLLRATTSVTVLATSRQPLDVPGEHTMSLSPLPAGAAVQLFAQLAATVVPGFAVTDANRADVTSLCTRLDGVPLALELAAVRLRALPLPQLAGRLEDRFRLLTGGRRSGLAHHQTLRSATEWSYDLCTPGEQLLWARLSVFAGAFDVASAEEVCAGGGLARADVLATLIGLVDKSIVLRDADRYWLLDTIREFGAEKLGGDTACRDRFLARYTTMAEYLASHFTDDQLAGFRALRAEHADIRAALDYALTNQPATAARLVTALAGYWHISGLVREGKYWLTKVLEKFPDPVPERARLLITRCYLVIGDEDDGREGIAIAERLGDQATAARGYLYLNLSLATAGRVPEATQAGAEAARRLEAAGDAIGLLGLDSQLGQLRAVAGDADLAIEYCRRGLARSKAGGELWWTSYLHYTTGLARFEKGEHEASAAALNQALALKAELGDTMGIAHCLEVHAWLAVATGRQERAAWLLGAAAALWQRTGRRLSGNPFLSGFHQQAAHAASGALGKHRYKSLRERGACHPLDELITLTRDDADELPAPPAGQLPAPGTPAARTQAARTQAGAAESATALTNREHEIARLVAGGMSNREIAELLVISKRTVDAHIEHIFAKLGMSSRVQLTRWLRSSDAS
jgi:predicted ATPase/DNA-binding CsgD family transcriptional regulator